MLHRRCLCHVINLSPVSSVVPRRSTLAVVAITIRVRCSACWQAVASEGGQVVGESDAKGELPKDSPITPDDIAASFYATLGISHKREYKTPSGRPVMIVRNGKPIRQLFS